MKLYEISQEFLNLQSLLESGEIDQDTFNDTIEAIDCAFEDKARNCMMIKRQLEADSESIKAEIERLSVLKKSAEASAERITDYLRDNMATTGKDKLDLGLFKLTLRQPTKKLDVLDESLIPAEYWVVVPETKRVDKAGLTAALKLGEIEGARLIDGERALLIK